MKQRKVLNNKEKILRAAAEEFIEYGFYGARMQRIANRAKVNKAMIHYYFSNKENIYRQVLETVFNILLDKLNSIDMSDNKESNAEEKMREIIDVYTEIFKNYSSYVKLVIYEVITGGKFLPYIISKNFNKIPFNPFTGKIYKYFKMQIKKGNIRKLDIFQMLISLIIQMAPIYLAKPVAENVFKILGFNNLLLNEFIKKRKEFVMDIIKNGIFKKRREKK